MIEAGNPDLLQLHGNETPDHVAAIRVRFGLPVIKSIPIETARRSQSMRQLGWCG